MNVSDSLTIYTLNIIQTYFSHNSHPCPDKGETSLATGALVLLLSVELGEGHVGAPVLEAGVCCEV